MVVVVGDCDCGGDGDGGEGSVGGYGGGFDFSNWFIQEYIYNQVSVKLRISQIACKNISNKRINI